MSEQKPQLPEALAQFDHLQATTVVNGENQIVSRRVYGVDTDGKMRQIAGNAVLAAYGYEPSEQQLEEQPAIETSETAVPSVYDRFAEIFNKVAEDYAEKRARETMDKSVTHRELLIKHPSDFSNEDKTELRNLIDEVGMENAKLVARAARATVKAEAVRQRAQQKIDLLQAMKRARGGEDSELDSRIETLQASMDTSADTWELTRNRIAKEKIHANLAAETRDIDPFEFWSHVKPVAAKPVRVTSDATVTRNGKDVPYDWSQDADKNEPQLDPQYDFTPNWDSGEQFESDEFDIDPPQDRTQVLPVTQDNTTRFRNRMRNRWTALRVGDFRGAFGSVQEGKNGRLITSQRLVGATALTAFTAGLYLLGRKSGIDITPFDGDGFDLNPLNNDLKYTFLDEDN